MVHLNEIYHNLVPEFILDKLAHGETNGRFPGVGLFVDVSGFTAVTETLMRHGQHGAEELASVMSAIFTPLLEMVYAYDGFVVGFAGDAFTAVFPADHATPAAIRALAAGWQMQQRLATIAHQQTDYGSFTFSVKIGVEQGTAIWGILQAADSSRAAYYFRGTAVAGSAHAEHHAASGDLVLAPAAYAALKAAVTAEARADDHWCVTAVTHPLPAPTAVSQPAPNLVQMARFFPSDLITQPISGEFRHIFNLFIGLKGTPSPEELAQFMQVLFTLQDRYGGLLNRVDFADKGCHLLLFWGAPVSHENDAQRILNFALDLRAESPLPLRAGLTYRIAHAGFVGSTLREDFTCYGRGVNLAARFMTTAPWGELWVDEQLVHRAGSAFEFEFWDELTFKGFADPQPVQLLHGRQQVWQEDFYSGDMVGRDGELAQLSDFLQTLQHGRFAGAATIIGEAGVGKSRLIHATLEQSDVLDIAELFFCQTDEILRQSLNPFRYWLRDYFDQLRGNDDIRNHRRFDRIFDGLLADIADADLHADLRRGRSFLAALVDLFWPESRYAQTEAQHRLDNVLAALKALIRAECQRQPVILHLEDAHWLDNDSLAFLAQLTRNVADLPLALLVSSRIPLPAATWAAETPLLQVELGPLGAGAVAAFATDLLGQPPAPNLLAFLQQRTDGNPYFVEQLLLYLQQEGLVIDGELRLPLGMTGSLIPGDTQSLLVARLDRLPRPVKELAQMAAVLGREFDTLVLQQMTVALSGPTLVERLDAAEAAAVVTAVAPNRYIFRHSLMREAAYDMQLRARLRTLHHSAASAYEAAYHDDPSPYYGQIAYHFDQANAVVLALPYYEKAANRAQDNFQNEDALAYYQRGLALAAADALEMRYRLLLGQEAVLNWVARRDEQAAALQQLLALLDALPDPARRAEVALRQAVHALGVGDYEGALTAVAESVQYAQAADDGVAAATALHRWGRILWQQGHFQQARPYLEQALGMVAETDALLAARCLYDLGVVLQYEGDYAAAEARLVQAQGMFAANNDRHGEFSCLNLEGVILLKQGRYVAALEKLVASLALCRDLGWRYSETRVLAQLGNVYFELGDYAQARQYHQQALALCRETGNREDEAVSLDTLGLVAHYLHDLDTAVAYFQEALAIHEQTGNVRDKAYALTHLGYSQVALGDGETAVSHLQAALDIRRELGVIGLMQDTLAGLALAAWRQSDHEQAAALVTEIVDYLQTNGPDGIEFPAQVYLICAQIAADLLPDLADGLRDEGVALLNGRAALIQDADLRRQFLTQVPFNRELVAGGWGGW